MRQLGEQQADPFEVVLSQMQPHVAAGGDFVDLGEVGVGVREANARYASGRRVAPERPSGKEAAG